MKKLILLLASIAMLSVTSNASNHASMHKTKDLHSMYHENPIYHVNPMPNFMIAIKMMGSNLGLSKKQELEIKEWEKRAKPMMNRLVQNTIKAEKALLTMSFSNISSEQLISQYKTINTLRRDIAMQKILCRSNLEKILNAEQEQDVKKFYLSTLSQKHFTNGKN